MKKLERIEWLDALRGIAIAMVILFHFTSRYAQLHPQQAFVNPLPLRFTIGWVGVDLFFMISGFIIYLSIQHKAGVKEFLVARFARILPPFWAALAFCVALEYLEPSIYGNVTHTSLRDIAFNALMIPDLAHARVVSGVFWSLFVEVKFYFVFALLWATMDMRKESRFFGTFFILAALAATNSFIHPVPFGFDLSFFLLFWFGIGVCKLHYENLSPYKLAAMIPFLCIGACIYVAPQQRYTLMAAIPVLALLIWTTPLLFARVPSLIRATWPLAALGRISYSLYLTHESLGYLVLAALAIGAVSHATSLAVTLAVCFAVAIPSYRYIERQDRTIARRVLRLLDWRAKPVHDIPAAVK